jgi:hypothetical protein
VLIGFKPWVQLNGSWDMKLARGGSALHATHGSWLNQAEIEISIFARQCLGSRRIPDLKTLRREARAWNRHMNRAHTKINWQFNRKTARRKFGYKTKSFTRSKT